MPAASILREYLMPYIGISNVNLIPANASTRMRQTINQTLQEIFGGEFRQKLSLQVRAPTPITLGQVTAGSTAITFAGWQSWMLGCTVVISGDGQGLHNQFELNGASPSLNAPYQGSTQANVAAVVYQDALNLTTQVKEVFPPVLLNGQYQIEPLDSPRTLAMSRTVWRDEYNTVPKIIRRPQWYILEDNLPYLQTPTTRITFDALPDTSYVCSFEALLAAPRITDWNDTRDYFMPGQEDESILYPWVLGKFLAWPQFIGDSNIRAQVAADAAAASQRWSTRSKGFTHTAVDVQSW